ncbi:MAG: 3-oxoacyl-[acyl-carrier-protein] reductase [Bdellovibrionales bacterium]|nr:3-oxoacyl-[acyl-carrier-protein] reductase [Bdellovibrionales bacterium]
MTRIALVTGGSRGIGKAIATQLASEGLFVCVNYRKDHEQAKACVTEIRAAGGEAQAYGFDISDEAQVQAAIDQITQEHGGIDVLVNNAGIARDALLLRAKSEDWDQTLATNLSGLFYCCKYALKSLLKRKQEGRIINISSVVGVMGNAGQTAYSAAKAGIIGFTKSLAKEVASRQITANVVAPGFVRTDMTDALSESQKEQLLSQIPLQRWAEPEDIANLVTYLTSPEAAYITGQVIQINGGLYL